MFTKYWLYAQEKSVVRWTDHLNMSIAVDLHVKHQTKQTNKVLYLIFSLSKGVFVVIIQDVVMLNGFGTVVNALGKRVKPYLPQICGTILWRLNNKSAKVRQQAADLISRIAIVMKTCQEVGTTLNSLAANYD